MSAQELTITRPDDWHLHLRDDAAMAAVLPDTARRFGRAIVMPNLRPPVIMTELAAAYRERILTALPAGRAFQPLMTLYLTDRTPPAKSTGPWPAASSMGSSSIQPGPRPTRIRVSPISVFAMPCWRAWNRPGCRCSCMVK